MKQTICMLLIILLLAVACKKKPIVQQPRPGSNTENTAYTPLPAPAPAEERTDTFIGTFKTWEKEIPFAEIYVKSTREDAYVTGNFTVPSMTYISRQVIDYQIKKKYNSVSLILHSTSDESWEVDISQPNDSITLNWIHRERLFAKGPTSGMLTTKEASFAGKRKTISL